MVFQRTFIFSSEMGKLMLTIFKGRTYVLRTVILSALTVLIALQFQNPFQVVIGQQQRKCATQTLCMDFVISQRPCVPLPTTLPAVSTDSPNEGYGFRATTDNCGARGCYILFACVCGPPLGVGLCYGNTLSGECDTSDRSKVTDSLLTGK